MFGVFARVDEPRAAARVSSVSSASSACQARCGTAFGSVHCANVAGYAERSGEPVLPIRPCCARAKHAVYNPAPNCPGECFLCFHLKSFFAHFRPRLGLGLGVPPGQWARSMESASATHRDPGPAHWHSAQPSQARAAGPTKGPAPVAGHWQLAYWAPRECAARRSCQRPSRLNLMSGSPGSSGYEWPPPEARSSRVCTPERRN